MGEGEEIAGFQEVKYGGGHISPFPKGLRLCIIGLVFRVMVKVQPELVNFLGVERFEVFFHDGTT